MLHNLKSLLARDISTVIEEKGDNYFKHKMNVNKSKSQIEGKRIWKVHSILLKSKTHLEKKRLLKLGINF